MNNKNYTIRAPKVTEHNSWLKLWKLYLKYYKSEDHSEALTLLLWERIQETNNTVNCLVVEDLTTNKLVGFVHFLPQTTTWQREPECYLEDLFVLDECRGEGLGNQLIESVVAETKVNGWKEVYWQTQFDNDVARGLYDKITGGTDGYVIYRITAD
ncbi:MAG: GNAT family N-acetyltransferase [Colwellia sp.]